MAGFPVLVLGGYGNFGGQIARRLAADPAIRVLVGGRDGEAAERQARALPGDGHRGVTVDARAPALAATLAATGAGLVIHTSGPFQGQDYAVARACLEAGCDYVDLADARGFVEGFEALDPEARAAGRVLISGASTVPAVSGAAVRAHAGELARLDAIHIGITPGQCTPRGRATLAGVLSYCGRPFRRWENGGWRTRHGWQDLRWFRHPALGRRVWGACDVPDLGLFPQRWPSVHTVTFHAGLELTVLQLGLWGAAAAVRAGLVRDWARHADKLLRAAAWLDRFGTRHGGMFVHLAGTDARDRPKSVTWWLTAWHGDGPFIPCVPAVVLARRLARGDRPEPGARPGTDLLSLEAFDAEVADRWIEWQTLRRVAS